MDPSVISHYTILEKLGEGGMGIVYKARDGKLDRLVAIKFLPQHLAANEAEQARFLQEAKAASALNHPNVCTIHDINEADNRQFIVMEYVDGTTLKEKLPVAKLQDAVTYALQIGDALHEAHGKGIVHRDIKCENIMVNAKNQIKVMDFGLAKLKGSLKLTKASSTVGTLAYMAPEQIQGGDVDARSDIFSFGVVMFEMLTGRLPFRGEHEAAMMYSLLNEEPTPIEQFRPDVPPALSNLIQRCLEKDPADRFQNAGDVVADLRRVQKQTSRVHRSAILPAAPGGPESSPPLPTERVSTAPVRSGSRTMKRFLWPAMALLLIAAAFVVYKFVPGSSGTRQFQQMKITRLTNSGKVNQAAVSPDGRYVVYAQEDAGKRSLWVRQTATTSNVQVVPPSDDQYFKMLFSRDGNFVYVLKAEKEGALAHLYTMAVLGGPMRKLIHNVNDFTLAPDGMKIGFIRYTIGDATFELIVCGADGSGERVLGARKAPRSYTALTWAPDARSITCALGDVNNVSVASVPLDGGQSTPIANLDWNTITGMEWLQDGSGIVVVPQDAVTSAGAQIWELAYPSGEKRRITNDLNNYTSISLTADARSLVTTETEYHSAVWNLPANGGGKSGWNADQAKQLSPGKDDGFAGVAQAPDGRIVYGSPAGGTPEIWIMDSDGTNPRQLTNGDLPAAEPTVSPDGKYIIYTRAARGSVDIWRMNLDGTGSRQLSHGDYAFTPAWTPDSRWVVYSHLKDGKYDLWKIPVDGGDPVQITRKHSHTVAVSYDGRFIACEYQENEAGTSHTVAIFPIEGGEPVKTFERQEYPLFGWLPDGHALGVLETRDGVPNLWTLPLDGSKQEPLTRFKGDKIFAFAWSRDGKSLTVARGPVVSDVIMINDFR